MTTSLYVCLQPEAAHWQLGQGEQAPGRLVLLGWSLGEQPLDAGVPGEIADLLSAALVSLGSVAFLDVMPSQLPEGMAARQLSQGSLLKRLGGAFRRMPADAALLMSARASDITPLFESASFPWVLQGQVGFLVAAGAPVPALTAEQAGLLMSDQWVAHAEPLREHGIVGLLRPGVDGDVAGFLGLNDAAVPALLQSLELECERRGVAFVQCSEEAFSQHLRGA